MSQQEELARGAQEEAAHLRAIVDPERLRLAAEDRAVELEPHVQLAGETELILVDLGEGRNRLGGSILAQVFSQLGDQAPAADPRRVKSFFEVIQQLRPLLLAYHDRSDGGLFATAC